MPYAVAHRSGSINQLKFDIYLRLLGQRGIDWTSAPRTQEPGTEGRWNYIWSERAEAESFREELCRDTGDDRWYVHEISTAEQETSTGPLMPVLIRGFRQSIGSSFSLHPHSRAQIRRRFPDARQLSSVYIEHGHEPDFETRGGLLWEHIAEMLTGLSEHQLEELGGYRVVDSESEDVLFDSTSVSTAAL